MSTYEKANKETEAIIHQVMRTDAHTRLVNANVTVYTLMAHASLDKDGEPNGPALTDRGMAVIGKVKITSAKHRVAGLRDVELLLDGDKWPGWTNEEKAAIIDHELTHLEIIMDGDDGPKLDDGGRPRLRNRPHDHEHGWFDEVAARHGAASQEVQQAKALVDDVGQLYFNLDLPMVRPLAPRSRSSKRLDS